MAVRKRIAFLAATLLVAGAAVGFLVVCLASSPLTRVDAASGDSLYLVASDRYGVGVNPAYGNASDYDVAQIRAGWYVDWGVQANPSYPAGLDYMQIVQTEGETFSSDLETLGSIARSQPGMVWIIGNEPDCVWQGNSTPGQYVTVYHQLYTSLKEADPTARITIGGIVQVTPLRLQWLDAVLSTYQSRYGEPFPVDLWNIHTFILQEKSCVVYPYDCWGAGIPPGVNASVGVTWGLDEHDRLDLIEQQIVQFRQWMADHGERDKELIVSEYGILMPDSYGYDAPRVETFMLGTFDIFSGTLDVDLGYPVDGNRLVQRWAWYSLNDKRFEGHTSHSHLFEPDTHTLTPLGLAFRDYVSPLYAPYVDLAPAALTVLPSVPLVANGEPITISLTAMVRNLGNVDASGVPVRVWVGDADQPIAADQVLSTVEGRALATVSVDWINVTAGVYTVGMTIDLGNVISETNEANNEQFWRIWVAGHGVYLPVVYRE